MAGLEQKRIVALNVADNAFIDHLINVRSDAAKWYMPVDFCLEENPTEVDAGTKRIPASRIAFLTTTGLIPESMLPNYVSETIYGDMSFTNNNWTFTANDGTKYSCPNPGSDQVPSMDYVYVDNTPSDDYYQYRFVPAVEPTDTNVGTFVPIPSSLRLVDGNGTVIKDNASNYTRQIDISLASPAAPIGQTIIETQNNKLLHVTSGVTPGSYGNASAATPGFGQTFNTIYETVNPTGHVTSINQYTVKMPDTAASATVAGLVKIGQNSDVQGISASGSIGNSMAEGYYKVAAANHTHTASNLVFTNTNESNRTTFTYNGSTSINYDMNNILKTKLPTVAPITDRDVISYDGTGAKWVDIDTLIKPDAISCKGNESSVTGTSSTIPLTSYDKTANGRMSMTSNTISGLIVGHAYAVTYNITFVNSTATAFMHNITINATGVDGGQAYHNLNGSYLGKQAISGSFIVRASATTMGFNVKNGDSTSSAVFTSGSWKMTANLIQVAEVK